MVMVTQQQLKTASQINIQIAESNDDLRQVIQTAIDLKIAGVDVSGDASLINNLQTRYTNIKANLATLVGSLP